MADIQPTETSAASIAATSNDSNLSKEGGQGVPPGGSGAVKEDGDAENDKDKASTTDAPATAKDSSTVDLPHTEGTGTGLQGADGGLNEGQLSSSTTMQTNASAHVADSKPDSDGGNASSDRPSSQAQAYTQSTSSTSTPPLSTTQQHQPPLKRFTSVNITKRFLEKTSSQSGTSLGGGSSSAHSSGLGSSTVSGQLRGNSPVSRSPSTDRPASSSSRLVTAKLTAVPQPSSSTAGWLRPPAQTPGSSAAPTPPSTSPQPNANELLSTMKRRPGESPVLNGSASLFSGAQSSNKPVWRRVPAPPPGRTPVVSDNPEDFPTAAEAVHGRKQQVLKAQAEAQAEADAAQKARDALNETAAAFRGAHLDANARHWDEMEDEDDTDFLNGVIEFGDGRQYKIERHESPPAELGRPPPEPESHGPVNKEERFGKDIGRDWPKGKSSVPYPPAASSFVSRPIPSQSPGTSRSPTDASAQSPLESVSPTSRVLFNERSNRLEPWNTGKPQIPSRQQGPSHPPQPGRDAPSHPHSPSGNVQLLQKGSSTESAWKSGPPRGFNHMPDRGRWDGPPPPHGKGDDRPWDRQRRESVSSTAGSSVRERSRGRESRWGDTGEHNRDRGRRDSNVGQPPVPMLPPTLSREQQNRPFENGRHPLPHLRMPPPPMPPMRGPSARDSRPVPTSPSMSVRSTRSLVSEQAPVSPSQPATSPPPVEAVEIVDKDTLVKDAMHLAIERAKKRKEQGEEEEKRRQEAAERARKKAEEIAAKLEQQKDEEERKKAEEQAVLEAKRKEEAERVALEERRKAEAEAAAAVQKAKEEAERAVAEQARASLLASQKRQEEIQASQRPSHFADSTRTGFQGGRPPAPGPLPRRPTDNSLATQADSWRSKAAPITGPPPVIFKAPSKPSQPQPSSEPAATPVPPPPPPPMEFPVLDLSIKPDEEIEVVDFSDMEKLASSRQ
ncbi:hypothetical protein M422DRAFT_67178 [Sphaerobolus stellatus SS14]|uniref:Uncharacterized protein n=1 Tax=Sphaerobolus stellatus (strain SS14) TaxID=990650 RepID=A0A0C9VT69_SPHS4|nr:hypothetical protein M422DRAFT_67178 [Sphaerobolus stellatus SS14]